MIKDVLKKYDRLLTYKRNLDGTIVVYRKSPFNASADHELFSLTNQFLGSARWIRDRMIKSDTTRFDIIGDAIKHNLSIRKKKDDRAVHEELADFMYSGGSQFIN